MGRLSIILAILALLLLISPVAGAQWLTRDDFVPVNKVQIAPVMMEVNKTIQVLEVVLISPKMHARDLRYL